RREETPSPVPLSGKGGRGPEVSGIRIVRAARPTYNPGRIEGAYVTRHAGWAVMGVYLTRPPVSDLVFQVYGRPLHPELFDILATRKVQREDYELTVWITRTGHVISWDNANVHLTEVTAAADQT